MSAVKWFTRKVKQETVNGITFDPRDLFLELVGTDLEGAAFLKCVTVVKWRNYREAVRHAETLLREGPQIRWVGIQAWVSEEESALVSTVWRDE